jgi:hypothetical protein|tara:strand:+ start:1152 stop:1340 length:189 start_codon:yes stop_codon:yes gene_type:complete
MKTIRIEVNAGVVTDVKNIPEGYDYEIVDHDIVPEEEDKSAVYIETLNGPELREETDDEKKT